MGHSKLRIGFFEIIMFTLYLPVVTGIYAILLEFAGIRESLLESYHFILHVLVVAGFAFAVARQLSKWLNPD